MKILETERLILRTMQITDAPFYRQLLNTREFVDHLGDRKIHTLKAARDSIRTGPVAMQALLGHSIYLVELKSAGAPIGMSGLIKRDTLEDVDLGYAFLPEYFGQGFAREAALAVLEHARRDIGLRRVVAITSPCNEASNRVLARVGMGFEKIVYLGADDPGTKLYAITLGQN